MDHNSVVTLLIWFVPIAGLIGVGFAVYMMRDVLGDDPPDAMSAAPVERS